MLFTADHLHATSWEQKGAEDIRQLRLFCFLFPHHKQSISVIRLTISKFQGAAPSLMTNWYSSLIPGTPPGMKRLLFL